MVRECVCACVCACVCVCLLPACRPLLWYTLLWCRQVEFCPPHTMQASSCCWDPRMASQPGFCWTPEPESGLSVPATGRLDSSRCPPSPTLRYSLFGGWQQLGAFLPPTTVGVTLTHQAAPVHTHPPRLPVAGRPVQHAAEVVVEVVSQSQTAEFTGVRACEGQASSRG